MLWQRVAADALLVRCALFKQKLPPAQCQPAIAAIKNEVLSPVQQALKPLAGAALALAQQGRARATSAVPGWPWAVGRHSACWGVAPACCGAAKKAGTAALLLYTAALFFQKGPLPGLHRSGSGPGFP